MQLFDSRNFVFIVPRIRYHHIGHIIEWCWSNTEGSNLHKERHFVVPEDVSKVSLALLNPFKDC
jgi:hypothetical protein